MRCPIGGWQYDMKRVGRGRVGYYVCNQAARLTQQVKIRWLAPIIEAYPPDRPLIVQNDQREYWVILSMDSRRTLRDGQCWASAYRVNKQTGAHTQSGSVHQRTVRQVLPPKAELVGKVMAHIMAQRLGVG